VGAQPPGGIPPWIGGCSEGGLRRGDEGGRGGGGVANRGGRGLRRVSCDGAEGGSGEGMSERIER
jgi:hypothetical protein